MEKENSLSIFESTADGMLRMLSESGAMDMIFDRTKKMMWSMVEYKEMQMMYTSAIKEIKTKLDILDSEFKLKYRRNPIYSVTSRLKKTESVMEKMMRRGYPITLENIENYINDIAGVRVVCSYVDDVYFIADALTGRDDITLLVRKDYIENPKANGYRSLHLIVSVPVYFAEVKKDVKVEIQIRTIAMDCWASLEHQMKYKKDIPDADEISAGLLSCAADLAETDRQMLSLRRRIEMAEDAPTEEDELLERLSRIGLPL